MNDVASERKVIAVHTCKQNYNTVTLINMPDSKKQKSHMSIIKTS